MPHAADLLKEVRPPGRKSGDRADNAETYTSAAPASGKESKP